MKRETLLIKLAAHALESLAEPLVETVVDVVMDAFWN